MYSVLYVDDDQVLLDLNKIHLEMNGGFSVDVVQSAEEALDKIACFSYDAILSDYQMPGMDGIELLKKVRKKFGKIPFILFTGKGREEVVIQAVNCGVDYYIQKGVDLPAMTAELTYKLNRAIERRQIENALRQSRQQLKDIINFLPDATFVIDTKGSVIAWNHAIEMMTGIKKEAMIGKGNYEYSIPFFGDRRPTLIDCVLKDYPEIASDFLSFERYGNKLFAEMYAPCLKGGKGANMWLTAGPIYDSQEVVTGAIVSFRDVSEIRKLKRDLNRSHEMNVGFGSLLPVAIFECDGEGRITYANNMAFELFRIEKEDRGQPIRILDFIAPSDREFADRGIRRIMAGEKLQNREYHLMRQDGTIFPALVCGGAVVDPETGHITGLRGVVVDLTARKNEAKALQESKERLQLAVRAADIGLWDVDLSTMTVQDLGAWINRKTGFPSDPDRITVNKCMGLIHPLDIPGVFLAFRNYTKKKLPLFETEFRIKCSDGSWKWALVQGKVIETDKKGLPVRITGTVSDITGTREHRLPKDTPVIPSTGSS
ncbi:MAG: putative diguanylate cyclase [Methanoregula sp. PtaU1.Bin051]|nr:MAG: putative diguanylate cyclase [Methanoregula sp. PtaU1.Bin051]